MKRKPTWWKLYLFTAVSCIVLFLFPPTNQAVLIIWMLVMYGGIAMWLMANQKEVAETVHYNWTVIKPPVAEFFDEDRVDLQQHAGEIPDDNVLNNPYEVI